MGSDDVASTIWMMFVAPFIAYILYLILNYIAKHTPFGPYVSKGGNTHLHCVSCVSGIIDSVPNNGDGG